MMKTDLEKVADAIGSVASQLRNLGLADAATPLGAVEALIIQNEKDAQCIGSAIESGAECIGIAIEKGFERLAVAIERSKGVF